MQILRICFFILFILLFVLRSVSFARQNIELAVGEWPPYISEYMDGNGMCAEIVNAAFNQVGISTTLSYYPWRRALLTVRKGGLSGSFPWAKRSEREKYALYSDALHKQKHSFFYFREMFSESEEVLSFERVKKYVVGVPMGYAQYSELTELGYNCELISSSSNGVLMLLKGHIDFLYESDEVGRYLIKVLLPGKENKFGEISIPIGDDEVYLLFPKARGESRLLLEKFNRGLRSIRKDGTYKKIVGKYLMFSE